METQGEPEKGICIVSFDGGGPGSISQLLLVNEALRRIESDLDLDENTLCPADYWDLMGGVGFGGFCALLLGRLRMSVEEAMEELANIGSAIFPQDISEIATPEGNLTILREAIEAMLRRHGFPVDIKLNDKALRGSRCKVVVFAASTSLRDCCHRFRTYASGHSGIACTFVEAACATLATPPYFAPVAIGPTWAPRQFVGTPLGFNNPIRPVLEEARSKFGHEKKVSLILSLGSGRPAVLTLDWRAPSHDSLHNILTRAVLDCEGVAREISDQLLHLEVYLRINVDQGMENIKVSDWDKLGSISEHTDAYLHKPEVESSIDICSRFLKERNASTSLGGLNWTRTTFSAKAHPQQHSGHLVLSPTGVKQMSEIVRDAMHGITLLDAIGNRVQIPMEWCRTYSMLEDMISCYFRHQKPPGAAFVGRGDYRLVHGKSVIEPARWTYDLRAGYTVEMSMVLRKHNDVHRVCPKCGVGIEGSRKFGWAVWKVSYNHHVRGKIHGLPSSSCSGRFQIQTKFSDKNRLVLPARQV